jgi:hypothetical protein
MLWLDKPYYPDQGDGDPTQMRSKTELNGLNGLLWPRPPK